MKKHLYVIGCGLIVCLTAGTTSEAGCRHCSGNSSPPPREQSQPRSQPQPQPQRQTIQPRAGAPAFQPRDRTRLLQQSYQRQTGWPHNQPESNQTQQNRPAPGWNAPRVNRLASPNSARSPFSRQPRDLGRQPGYSGPSREAGYPGSRGQNTAPAAPRLVHLDRATDVKVNPGSKTITAVRREPNGAQLHVETHIQQNGLRRMAAYRVTTNVKAGTTSRAFIRTGGESRWAVISFRDRNPGI